MYAELNRQGHRIARCTVHRLMRTHGLPGISRAKGPRTTLPGAEPDRPIRKLPHEPRPHTSSHRASLGPGEA